MSRYFLGIDNGGTVCKAALYDCQGNQLALASRKIGMLFPAPGFTEKNMDEFWQANREAIAEVVKKSRIDPREIAGVAPTGHGNGMFLIDEQGTPIGNGIISTDIRAKSWVDRWYADGTFERINKKTLQSIWAAQPVALLNWFKQNQPEVLDKTRWILMCKDYIRYKLTGEIFAEITDYSGTNLVNVLTSAYDSDLLNEFGIADQLSKLPPLRLSSDICGGITRETAAQTGLAEGTPVAGGMFDIHACAIATGLVNTRDLCIIAGTWSINEFISQTPVGARELFMTSIYCIPGYWLVTEASPTSASNLEWFIRNFMEGVSYEEINSLAASLQPEDSDVIFFPFLFGSKSGIDLSASFMGLHSWHSKVHMLRAVYEGVVFGHKLDMDKLLKYRDRPEKIRISGGASKSEVWVQMFADILQLPVEVSEGDELGTLGAAICAAVGAGEYEDFAQAAGSMVRISRIVQPNPDKAGIYEDKYSRFKANLEAVKSVISQ